MDYDNFGSILTSKRLPTFIPNRINGISGKQLIEGTGISSDLNLEGNGIYAFRNTFSELENVDGLRLGIDKFDNKAKFFIGDPNHFMKWDGENATINGKLYSVEGDIGGWIINSTSLTGNQAKLLSSGSLELGVSGGRQIIIDGNNEKMEFYSSDGVLRAVMQYDQSQNAIAIIAEGSNRIAFGNNVGTPQEAKIQILNQEITLDAPLGVYINGVPY